MIIDTNTILEVFGTNPTQAGEKVFDWISEGYGKLVIGGKLYAELEKISMLRSLAGYESFGRWVSTLVLSGSMEVIDHTKVESRTTELEKNDQFKDQFNSNDHHVIALAQISGARLLYSKDKRLHKDFKNKQLIDKPRGKVYPTKATKKHKHRDLLEDRNLCRSPK